MPPKLYNRVKKRVRYWLLHKLPACKDMIPLMSQSLERQLTLRERVVLKLHLWTCMWCVFYLEQLRLMREALRTKAVKVDEAESSHLPALSGEARDRLKAALKRGNS